MSQMPVLSVSELNAYVKGVLDRDALLQDLRLRGEISNFKRHSSGHMYFSLKDAGARIGCVLFRQNSFGLKVALRDGMSVVAEGRAALYERDGQYQFYVQSVQPDGVGTLYALLEQTKDRLRRLGYFDLERKRPLPEDPRTVGVVTSLTGAVLRDIVRVARRRNPSVNLLLCPAKVQGEGAAAEIASALERLASAGVDVILCGRGGGSLEDLWAFNEELVARAIYRCSVPVVSCVGHETDFTIADMVADVRAATPSQAAELAVPDTSARAQRLDGLRQRLESRTLREMERCERALEEWSARIAPEKGLRRLLQAEERGGQLLRRLEQAAKQAAQRDEAALAQLQARLNALNPQEVLRRGYALVRAADGYVTRAAQLSGGQRLRLHFADGQAGVVVENEESGRGVEDEREETQL